MRSSNSEASLIAAQTAQQVVAAVVSTNLEFIKKDVAEIKETLKRVVTKDEFTERVAIDDDHEKRIRFLERSAWKLIGAGAAVGTGLTFVLGYLLKLLGKM